MAESMRGPHDIGGLAAAALDTHDAEMTAWEKQANAMRMVLVGADDPVLTLDELRRAAEDLGDDYHRMAYFERTTEALRRILIERGVIEATVLDDRIAAITLREAETPEVEPRHPTRHAVSYQDDEEPGAAALASLAMQELLIDDGVLDAARVQAMIEAVDMRSTGTLGARVVAHAWADAGFKARLLDDGAAACAELGIDLGDIELVAVENTPESHNVVVCTLCSCYPRQLLGMPPHWYKSRSYRARCVIEPRRVLAEFGTRIGDDVTVRVHDPNADLRYLVLPMRPIGTDGWDEERLARLVTRDCMIGVGFPRSPE
jgi:nitrile hydratase